MDNFRFPETKLMKKVLLLFLILVGLPSIVFAGKTPVVKFNSSIAPTSIKIDQTTGATNIGIVRFSKETEGSGTAPDLNYIDVNIFGGVGSGTITDHISDVRLYEDDNDEPNNAWDGPGTDDLVPSTEVLTGDCRMRQSTSI